MNSKLIRKNLISMIGSKIVVIYYGSRNKKESYEGVLFKLYRNIFTIKLVSGEIKCFSYADLLTKTVQIYV